MDSDRLNKWLTLGANLGVLVGIIFLAVELRQNNENLATEVRATHFFSITDTWGMVAENPELAAAISKDFEKEELSSAENSQLQAYWVRVFLALQWGFREMPEEEFRRGLGFQQQAFLGASTHPPAWQFAEPLLDPEFVVFMNENVFLSE